MQIYHIVCKRCRYETKVPIGSSDLDQILTDINLDYAEYRLFVCKKEAAFVHADIHDKEFKGRCPSDDSDLMEIEEIPPVRCPRCSQAGLETEQNEPLGESSSAST